MKKNKMIRMITALSVAFAIIVGAVGCRPEPIAKQLGFGAALAWIGVDNPSQEEIDAVKTTLAVIESVCCTNCVVGGTDDLYDRAYPVVEKYIDENLEPNQRPIARLGAAFLLTSLNTAFQMNPKWKANADVATAIIKSFCEGAQKGLSLAPSDPAMLSVRKQMPVRLKAGKIQPK